MEKRTPQTALAVIKAMVNAQKYSATKTALITAKSVLGGQVTAQTLANHILALKPTDFYKAMTDDYDHKLWHEVYRPILANGVQLYIKLIIQDDVLIVSFKEK